MRKSSSIFLLGISFIVFTACEKTDPEPATDIFEIQGENGFIGMVDGTDAFIAVLIGEEEGVVYACNGEEEISEWFKGDVSDPLSISFSNSSGAKVVARFGGGTFEGELTLRSGENYSFSAIPNMEKNGGIFRLMGDEVTEDEIDAGWILNKEGDQRGSLKIKSIFQSAQNLSVGDLTDGTSNTVQIMKKAYPVFRFSLTAPSPAGPIPIPYPHFPSEPKKPG